MAVGKSWKTIVLVAFVLVAASCGTPPTGPVPPDGGYILPTDPTADTLNFSTIFSGLQLPTNAAFAPDGRVFVSEKAGVIKTYDNVNDPSATVAADLRADVRSVGEHGLVGLTVDNAYPTRPYIYAFYAWDSTGQWGDGCLSNYQINGCVTGAKLVKITVNGSGVMVGAPQTLVDDRWCFQFSGHSAGSVEMLSDGSLVLSAGEGANFNGVDYGQFGGQQQFPPVPNLTPRNPCADPPGGLGVANTPTTGQGGSLRAQDVLTDGDPVGWDSALVRINADTGAPMPDNPLVGSGTTDDDAIVAHGFRNPNRITVQPGTDRVFVGNVGQNYAEEIEPIDVTASPVKNSGWPCREGARAHLPFASLGNVVCEDLITDPAAKTKLTDPWFAYLHNNTGAAVTGLSFVPAGRYPQKYVGDLFFADYVKGNVYSISVRPDGGVAPVPIEPVAYQVGIVDMDAADDGYLYTVNIAGGTVDRLVGADSPPIVLIDAAPQNGPVPLVTNLDASASYQPGGGSLTFAWDLDDDGQFDDATGPITSVTFADQSNHDVRVRVTNQLGASSVGIVTLYPGNSAPVVSVGITSPLPWTAGEQIGFTVTATDFEDGPLSGGSVTWETNIRHCYLPTDCHSHPQDTGSGTVGSVVGPSHGFPSFLELTVRATDSRGQQTVVSQDLLPRTATITLNSSVPGATVSLGESNVVTPTTYTAIVGDSLPVGVSQTQVIGGVTYSFGGWSNGSAASHQLQVGGDTALFLTLVPQP